MSAVAAGWYVDPDDSEQERYWNGSAFRPGAKQPRRDGAREMPERFSSSDSPDSPSQGLPSSGAAVYLYVLAAVVALASIITGIALIAHGRAVCDVNPYDTDLSDCTSKSHPFRSLGAGVIIGGLIQASVLMIVAQLCTTVTTLTAALRKQD